MTDRNDRHKEQIQMPDAKSRQIDRHKWQICMTRLAWHVRMRIYPTAVAPESPPRPGPACRGAHISDGWSSRVPQGPARHIGVYMYPTAGAPESPKARPGM